MLLIHIHNTRIHYVFYNTVSEKSTPFLKFYRNDRSSTPKLSRPIGLSALLVFHPGVSPRLLLGRFCVLPHFYTMKNVLWQQKWFFYLFEFICQTKCKSEVAFTVTNAAVAFTPANLRQDLAHGAVP